MCFTKFYTKHLDLKVAAFSSDTACKSVEEIMFQSCTVPN